MTVEPTLDAQLVAVRRAVGVLTAQREKLAMLLGEGAITVRVNGVEARAVEASDDAAVVWIGWDGVPALRVCLSNQLTRELAQQIFGGPEELRAPRPLTVAESGAALAVVAAGLHELGRDAEIFLDGPKVTAPTTAVVELTIDGAINGIAMVEVDPDVAFPTPARQTAQVVRARCDMSAEQLSTLGPGDVVVVGNQPPQLVFGNQHWSIELARGGASVTVLARVVPPATAPDPDDVSLLIVLGEVAGESGRWEVGGGLPCTVLNPVELWAGGHRLGFATLLTVEGELAARIIRMGGLDDD